MSTPKEVVQSNINATFTALKAASDQCVAAKIQFDAHNATLSSAAAQAAHDALVAHVRKFQNESELLDQMDALT